MTTVLAPPRRARLDVAAWAVAAAGCAALLARPAYLPSRADPTGRLLVLFVVLGTVGAWWPMRSGDPLPGLRAAGSALVLGAAAFVAGWLATGGAGAGGLPAAHPLFARSLALNALAAVAEEAFFRRFLYGLLPSRYAVVGSAAAFALVHVTVWGWWVLPLDLAAGLLLSWQRAASGRWWVPAATHVLANALAIL